MKTINAYYRKHQTCRGCEGVTEEEAARLKGYASKHDMTVTEVLQKGIDLQYAMEDSQRS